MTQRPAGGRGQALPVGGRVTNLLVVAVSVVGGLFLSAGGALAETPSPPSTHTVPAVSEAVPEPDGYRMDDFRKPVPATLKGARVVDTLTVEKLHKDKAAIFIDVFPKPEKPANLPAGTLWRDTKHETIEGAHWLPNVGYGALPTHIEDYFRTRLATLMAAEPGKPLLFFCLRDCWMSWNAAKRAIEWGHKDVIWYSEGTDSWQEAGNDLTEVSSIP